MCRLLDNMEKCCTDGNIIRRIRFSCLITKDTNTHTEYAMLTVFAWQQRLYERAWMLRYAYECLVHCLSCSFNFFIPALIHFASFDVLTVIMKVKGFSEVTLFGGGQSTDIYFKLRRILRTGLVSHPRDDNLFHFIHIPLFVNIFFFPPFVYYSRDSHIYSFLSFCLLCYLLHGTHERFTPWDISCQHANYCHIGFMYQRGTRFPINA